MCSSWYPWKSPPEKFSTDNISNLLPKKFLVLLSWCILGCVATWTWLPWWRNWLLWKRSTTMSLSESPPWSWLRKFPTYTPESPLLGKVTMEVRWFPRESRAELTWRKLKLPWLPFPFCWLVFLIGMNFDFCDAFITNFRSHVFV